MYQISFNAEGKDKYISIRSTEDQPFSTQFVGLIGYINKFINSHKGKEAK